jgi:hypothetical protein
MDWYLLFSFIKLGATKSVFKDLSVRCSFSRTSKTFASSKVYPVYQKRKDFKQKTIKCIICSDSFTRIRNLASHLQNKHKYTFEQAREATGYPSRISVFLPGKPTSCKICSNSFPSSKSFKQFFSSLPRHDVFQGDVATNL